MTNHNSSYFAEIGGDFKGIQGDISGGVINQYIITQKSGFEITSQPLIKGSPYLGLRKFEVDDKDKFFGRDRWIIELTNYLEKKNVLLLLGASGSGKSSLVQAGLIPKLKDQWGSQLFNFTFVPDVDPFESFYGCLLTKYKQSEAKLARTVKEDTLLQVVQTLKSDAQWLIFIDQFEEVFTRTPKTERDIFIKSLIQLIENADSSVKVIMTMRADFLDKFSPYPDLGKVQDFSSRMLTDMTAIELQLAIAEPAARNGVTFEVGLIDQIINDFKKHKQQVDFKQQVGALPLLQYTLDLLWTKDDITDRVLNTKAYQELGGVTGALQQQADKIYDKFDETQQKLAKEIFLELIELGGKEAVSRRADKGIFERDETQREVLYQLIDNRLLVSKGEDGKATVEVAHEELIRSWKVLQDLIREKEEIIILRNRLYADAKSWQDAQKASSELWNGSKLARIVEFKKEQALPNLDGVTIEFIEASMAERDRLQKVEIERQKRDKRTAQRIAAGSLVAVVLVGGFGLMALNEKNTAEQRQNIVIKYLVSEPQRLLENNKQLEALMSIVDSLKVLKNMGGDNSITLGQLKSIMNKIWQRNHLNKHQAPVFGISFSPDGQRILSGGADGKIIVWNTNGVIEKEFTILGISPQVWGVAFSGDSKKVIAATSERDGNGLGKDGVIKVWDLSTKSVNLTKPVNLLGHKHGVVAITTSPNCDIIASSGEDATIRLWNINLQKQYQIREDKEVNKDNGTIYSTDFSPDCQYIASTGYFDGSVKIWDLNSRQEFIHSNPVQELKFDNLSEDKKNLYPNIVSSVNFSSDGTMLAAANYGGFVRIWNTKTWKKIIEFKAHHDQIYGMAFSPDSKFIASASREVRRSLVLWTLKGKEVGIFKGHTQAVNQVKFQRRNDKNANYLIASSSDDGTVGLWSINPDKSKTPEKLNEDILLHESCLSLRDYLITNKDIAPPERRRICDPVLESHLK